MEQTRQLGRVVKDGGSIDDIVSDRVFDVKLRRALSIYATSFSDNYLGQRSRELLKCVERFYTELGKARAGEERVAHFNRAVEALGRYFEIARLDKSVLDGLYI